MWAGKLSVPAAILLTTVLFVPVSTVGAMEHGHGGAGGGVMGFEGTHDALWNLKAWSPFLIGGYGDNFSYDGSKVTPLLGKGRVLLDAERNTGTQFLKLVGSLHPEKGKTYTGRIKIYFRVTPEGPSFFEGGVADFVYLHGDTGQGHPVMPKTRTFLASWGKADVYVNDELVYQGLDGHMMYTERSRDPETRAVYNADRSGFYRPKNPSDGSVARPEERELHFVAHSMDKDMDNYPPYGVFIHINFADVTDLSGGTGPGATSGCRTGHGPRGKDAAMAGCKCGMGRSMPDSPCGCAGSCGMRDCGCSR